MSEKQLTAFKCIRCGKINYPKRPICLNCRGRDFTEVKISGEGKLLTYTHLYAIPEGVEQLPLTLGLIEFEEGIRVIGQIEDQNVKIGDKLVPVWGFLRKKDGKEIYGFKFKLASE